MLDIKNNFRKTLFLSPVPIIILESETCNKIENVGGVFMQT